jgi:branched-subunit amino acid aminotransferase/4-amino-4-deoxychorismate lyase
MDGLVAEAATSNIGFYDGSTVVWPRAPLLPGITMRLLEPRLAGHGLKSVHRPVRLVEVAAFRAAFVMNSRGVAAVHRIDDTYFQARGELMRILKRAYDSVPWDTI